MFGQWLSEEQNKDIGISASLRIDLEDRGETISGHAYLFYPGSDLPGFLYHVELPKEPPHRTTVMVCYLHGSGGIMTSAERQYAVTHLAETIGSAPPNKMDVEFLPEGEFLRLNWSAEDGRHGSLILNNSKINEKSRVVARPEIESWSEFRQWAVSQKPRHYIFRGQKKPFKLVSSFHRTRRKDIRTWIIDDVRALYGAVAERLSYPLQIGNFEHNTAIWSILQHHGYPTPMIDWSFSPFVAAFFAFYEAEVKLDCKPRIFILDQVEWNKRYGKPNLIVDAAPNQLVVIESMPVANPRHAPQQAVSTVTNLADVESFIRLREQEDGVEYLTCCDLHLENRPQVMRELEMMGITFGSLFPGLDGICRDMRDRLFGEPT